MPRRDRVAAIDCGTNSIRLLVTDIADGKATELVREMRIVRLGQGVDATGRLADEAIERTLQATREYAELITMLGAERVRFCATSAARDAENADDFAAAVESDPRGPPAGAHRQGGGVGLVRRRHARTR